MENVQWYPGHMTKSIRMMRENLSLCEIVIELVDARAPYSSKNPDIDDLAKQKKRIIILNKFDLADPAATDLWVRHYADKDITPILCDSAKGVNVQKIITVCKALMKEKIEAKRLRGIIHVPIRAMVVGIPNVGKSTFINALVGQKSAKTGDKPGVTRGKQWIKIKEIELLDTPGILWPKFEDRRVGNVLAFTGAINDQIYDISAITASFLHLMLERYSASLCERYNITLDENATGHSVLSDIAQKRGFLMKGGGLHLERAGFVILDEFRGGKLGKITLELPSDI